MARIGYARVSTTDQDLTVQQDRPGEIIFDTLHDSVEGWRIAASTGAE